MATYVDRSIVYEELLGDLHRDQLVNLCTARLRRHVEDSRTHLRAAEESLERAMLDAAQWLDVAQTVTVDAALLLDQLNSLLRMQQRFSQSMRRAEAADLCAENGYARDISTESEMGSYSPQPKRRRRDQSSPRSAEETKETEVADVQLKIDEPATVDVHEVAEARHLEPGVGTLLMRRPDLGLMRTQLQTFQGIEDDNATTCHIQSLLTCGPPSTATTQEEWIWMSSMVTQIASICSFMENLPIKKSPSKPTLDILAGVIIESFQVAVSGVTEPPPLLMSFEQIQIAFLDISTCKIQQ